MTNLLIMILPIIGTFIVTRIIGIRRVRDEELRMIKLRQFMADNGMFMG